MLAETLDAMELLTRVDTFYSHAWTCLMGLMGVAIFLVGIVIPLLMFWHQRLSFARRIAEVRRDFLQAENRYRDELKSALDAIDQKVKAAEIDLGDLAITHGKRAEYRALVSISMLFSETKGYEYGATASLIRGVLAGIECGEESAATFIPKCVESLKKVPKEFRRRPVIVGLVNTLVESCESKKLLEQYGDSLKQLKKLLEEEPDSGTGEV